MRLPKRAAVLSIAFCLAAFSGAFAQQSLSTAKTLLWRISGKGMKRPSYLYGTIHLSDKRLFNFDEHLYHAMEATDGFAMELNPDEMVAYFVNNAFDDADNKKDEDAESGESPKLRDVLRDEDYRKYSPGLSKRLNKPAGSITTRDIVREKNRWVTDYTSKGSMPTFVDAYLYNLARRQGKWVGGIEDLSDQLSLIGGDVDRSDIRELSTGEDGGAFTLSDMISAYLAQDLDRIDEMINGLGENYKDALLIRRNGKMARRMDSLMAFRPMLFAVGAAHLPGDSGVIRLLRKRGFTVEPVEQGRKIAAADYPIHEVDIPWQNVRDKSGLYAISMPGNPVAVKMSGLLDMQFFFDLFNMRGYMITAVAGPRDFRNPDSTADEMAKSMFPGQRLRPQDVATADGLRGREYTSHRGGQHLQLRIFAKSNVLYVVAAIAMKRESLASPDLQRYFDSFRPAASTRAPRSEVFADSMVGLRFASPAPLERNRNLESKSVSEGWRLRAWSGQDLTTGAYVMLLVKSVEPGRMISKDTVLLEESYNNLRSKKNTRQFSRQKIRLDGYPALRIEGSEEDSHYTALTYVRGGQHVVLVVISDSLQWRTPGLGAVFTTARLLPYASGGWQQRGSAEGHFSAFAPAPWHGYGPEPGQTDAHARFRSYDSASGVTYFVLTDTLSSYASYPTDSSFWAEQSTFVEDEGDSVLYRRPVRGAAGAGYEVLERRGGGNMYLRVRKFLHGRVLYTLYAQTDRPLLFGSPTEKFFGSFAPDYPAAPFNVSASKTALLLGDLAGGEAAKRERAYSQLSRQEFTAADLPLLRSALLRSYEVPDVGGTAVNTTIGRKMAPLVDAPTLQFLRDSYPRLTGSEEALRMTVLNVLAAAKTRESYQTLRDLWTGTPPGSGYRYALYSALSDSLPLLKTIFPELLRLARDTAYGPLVAALGGQLVDSQLLAPALLRDKEADFVHSVGYLADKINDGRADSESGEALGAMNTMASFNSPASDAVVQKFYRSDKWWFLQLHAVELLAAKGKLDTAVIAKLAAKRESRLELFKMLRKEGKEAAFPSRYRTQQALASSAIYAAATDEESEASVRPLVTTVAEYRGSKQRFYLYEVSYGEGEEARSSLGVAGPYDAAGKNLLPEEDLTQVLAGDDWKTGSSFDYNRIFRDWLQQLNDRELKGMLE